MKRLFSGSLILGIVLGLFCILMTVPVYAGSTVKFIWDANKEPDLSGYRLYQSDVSGIYNSPYVKEIPAGTEMATLKNVVDGVHFWILTAYDDSANESGPSNEVTKNVIDTEAPAGPCLFRFWD